MYSHELIDLQILLFVCIECFRSDKVVVLGRKKLYLYVCACACYNNPQGNKMLNWLHMLCYAQVYL